MYAGEGASVTYRCSTMQGNSATIDGGAIAAVNRASVTWTHAPPSVQCEQEVSHNLAGGDGGGIYAGCVACTKSCARAYP